MFLPLEYQLQVLPCYTAYGIGVNKGDWKFIYQVQGQLSPIPVKGKRAVQRMATRDLFPTQAPYNESIVLVLNHTTANAASYMLSALYSKVLALLGL